MLDLPVFWPVLVIYFLFLLVVTLKHQIKVGAIQEMDGCLQDMIAHRYIPFSSRKQRYADVGNTPVRGFHKDRRDD